MSKREVLRCPKAIILDIGRLVPRGGARPRALLRVRTEGRARMAVRVRLLSFEMVRLARRRALMRVLPPSHGGMTLPVFATRVMRVRLQTPVLAAWRIVERPIRESIVRRRAGSATTRVTTRG